MINNLSSFKWSLALKFNAFVMNDQIILFSLLVDDEDNLADDGAKVESVNHLDSFDEVYRAYELTDFDRLLGRSIARTGE